MKKGINRYKMAEDLGLPVTMLIKLEEEKQIINPRLMVHICEYFGVELHEMFYFQMKVRGGSIIK